LLVDIPNGNDTTQEVALMNEHWHNATLLRNQETTLVFAGKDFFNDSGTKPRGKLKVFVKGTNFQLKVWEALLKIPMGAVTTYQGIAETIDHPKAVQVVGLSRWRQSYCIPDTLSQGDPKTVSWANIAGVQPAKK
jgi:O6-methylguanine-DNA--protein-cysteine methyltransferase